MKTMKFTFFSILVAFFAIIVACEENEPEFVVDPLEAVVDPADTAGGGSDTTEPDLRLATLDVRVSVVSQPTNDAVVEIYGSIEDRQDSVNQLAPNQITRRMERGGSEQNGWARFEFEMPEGINRKTVFVRATFTNPSTGETQSGNANRDVLVNQTTEIFVQL